ncbi:hypothetical protein EXU57_03050 [Segetibacter sp. 3557_3]|uniref:outer membrane beta-barrel protein n=1 Tax=Segetibacter sp. 3557_3 TaxID=2547429 RepID=UPI001058EE57|nr:outer membrane beta-barrel protein [Segetibacter sp. 3557_3]TDH29064.1 hypothetical protein EXU57_03050 [Segetibacter sp. 3557_3]
MSKNLTLLLFVVAFYPLQLIAQERASGTIKGKLSDTTSRQNLKDATISLLDVKDSTLVQYALSKADGTFTLENVPFGSHLLLASFQGYRDKYSNVSLSTDKPELNLGTILLETAPAELAGVTVKASPMVIKGDTSEFNANMFKTKPNSTAEDLLKKMPGLEVEKDGSIKAQGQSVTRIMVDGKRFFGDDPTLATRNLPTDMIDKIQIVDAQSDQSAFSGFDDGNRQMTINIVTKKDRRKGVFGKVTVGGGNDLKLEGDYRYAANTNISFMNGNRQISFIGQANNNNNQNFSAQDIFGGGGGAGGGQRGGGGGQRGGGGAGGFGGGGFGGGGFGGGGFGGGFNTGPTGITKTLAGGLNYSDVWSPKTSVNGSYFYNSQNRVQNTDRFRETYVTGDSSRFTTSNSLTDNKNFNNRFNFEIEHKFDTMNSILIRPYFTAQQTDNFSESRSSTIRGKASPVNDVRTTNITESKGYNFNNNILYRHRFAKRGRSISFNLTQALNKNESDRSTLSYNNSSQGGVIRRDTINQIANTDRNGTTYGGTIAYTEPIGKKGMVELNYNYNNSRNTSDQNTMQFNRLTGKYDLNNIQLSNNFENTNISNRFSVNYRRQISEVFNYTMGLGVQKSDLTSNNLTKKTYIEQSFYNFTPTFMLQYRKGRAMNVRLNYRGNTQQPNVTQLQDVIDNSNPLYITTGNPQLKQSFSHNINLMLTKFDPLTFKNIVVSINGSMTANSIGNQLFQNNDSITVLLDNGISLIPNAQFVRPINRNGGYNMSGFFNYGFPLKNPKSNINLTTNVNYVRSVNTITSVNRFNNRLGGASDPSYTNNYILGQTVRFTMNVKERLDLNFTSRSTFNIAQYSEQLKGAITTTTNSYFTEVASIEPTYSTKNGFILATDVDYNLSRGQAEGYNQSFAMWNASIAQQLFKKKQGEIRFTIYDLLNQNRSITRDIQQNYIEDTRTDVLRRYFMLTFTYNIRNFGGGQQQQQQQRGNWQPGMRPGGFGGPGGSGGPGGMIIRGNQ